MRDIMRGIMRDIMRGAVAGLGGIARVFYAPLTSSLIPITASAKAYTFTRNDTDATVTDFEGLVKDVTANEARFIGARRIHNLEDTVVVANVSVVRTTISGNEFTITGLSTGTSDRLQDNWLNNQNVTNRDFVYRIGVKANIPANIGKQIVIRFRNGVASAPQADITTNIVLTEEYQVISDVLNIPTDTLNDGVGMWIYGGVTDTASGVQIFERQVEEVTGQADQNPGDYASVGISEDHGSNVDGVKYFPYENGNTVASSVVTEANGAAISDSILKGVLLEEQRTNNCLHSEDLSNVAWVASNITKSSDGIQLPNGEDGTSETLTASAGNGTLLQTIALASAINNFSVYLQRKTGTGNVDITLDNGATWTTQTLTGVGTWDRVNIQGTAAANPIVGIRLVTSGNAVQMWGAQLETPVDGSVQSSYIPTVAATATRNNEELSYPQSNVDGIALEGSFKVDINSGDTLVGTASYGVLSGTNARYLYTINGVDIRTFDGTTVISSGTAFSSSPSVGVTWSNAEDTLSIFSNGAKDATGALDADGMVPSTTLQIGGLASAENSGAAHKNLSFWNGALTDAQMEDLTA